MNRSNTHADVAAAIISEGIYIAIATCDSAGNPWCSPVFYAVTNDLDFIFISAHRSRHATNIRNTGRAAWSVFWGEKRGADTDGVTLSGPARELTDLSEAATFANILYDQRFTTVAERQQYVPDVAEFEATGRRIYVLSSQDAHKVDKTDPYGVSRIKIPLSDLRGRISRPVCVS
jgi:pyridoxine/pyridoxamine 5'-phosphate oxidase